MSLERLRRRGASEQRPVALRQILRRSGQSQVTIAAMSAIAVRPVSKSNWKDFERFFEAVGSPHFCWCTIYRVSGSRRLTKTQKKSTMQGLVEAGVPIGVLAYEGDEPVGWCSIAPRETYSRLERSRTMPRVTPPGTETWVVLCFFVARNHRKHGVAHALLRGAVSYARNCGAKVIEGYPFDTSNIITTHRGHSRLFKCEQFHRDGRRWYRAEPVRTRAVKQPQSPQSQS